MSDRANRGVAWQRCLEEWNKTYRAASPSLAVVRRTQPLVRVLSRPHRTTKQFRAVFDGDGPPDFEGFIGGTGVSFDAKDCEGTRWSFGDLDRHQARDLEAVHLLGHRAFVALRIEGTGWVLPWSELGKRWWPWYESTTRAAPGEASVGVDDLRVWAWRMPQLGDWLGALR